MNNNCKETVLCYNLSDIIIVDDNFRYSMISISVRNSWCNLSEMIRLWPWRYSWVDWKFSFELTTFPVFVKGWMIIMITNVFYIFLFNN